MAALIYIHGFLSSPQSTKAVQTRRWLAEHRPEVGFHCPHLPPYPKAARAQLETLVEFLRPEPVALVGSSLGGFWATHLAERYDLPAVLINPSVAPWELMQACLGETLHAYYSDDSYRLGEEDVAEVRRAEVAHLSRPEKLWLLVQTGDETLDYRRAVAKYRHCHQTVEPGGSHAFDHFQAHLPALVDFLVAH